MKTILLFLFVSISIFASAQITFSRSDYGNNGDKVLYAVDSPIFSTINFGSTGPNHTWRFQPTNNYPKRYDSTLFFSATSDPNAPGVSANMLLRTVANGDQYQEVTDSFVKIIIDMPAYHVKGIKLKLFNFPLTYQSNLVDSTTATTKGSLSDFGIAPMSGVDSLRVDAKIYMNTLCDGWGNITIPDSTTYNCLRVTNSVFINADIFIHSIIGWSFVQNRRQTNTNYSWFAPNSKNYIANVALDTSGNISSFTYKVQYVPKNRLGGKLISITPDSLMQGDKINVIIKGHNTFFTEGTVSIYFYPCNIDTFQVINDTTIAATISCPFSSYPGFHSLNIIDPVLGWLSLYNVFKIIASPFAPKLISITPDSIMQGEKINAIIKGSNTSFTKGYVNIYINSCNIDAFQVINDTTITATISTSITSYTGSNYVQIQDSVDGYIPESISLKITASPFIPKLVSVSPRYGVAGQKLNVIINGSFTHFTKGGNYINFYPNSSSAGKININSFSVINDSVLSCNIIIDSNTSFTGFNIQLNNSIDGYLYLTDSFSTVNTGINSILANSSAINIYPNPANDELNISFPFDAKNLKFEIFNLTGKSVLNNQSIKNNTSNSIKISLENISSGMYFLKITDAQTGEFLSKKFLKE